jgi:ABC-type sugar transport system substrate-binding protein
MSRLPPLPPKFKKALQRIKDKKAQVINLNRAITPTAVAREAGFDSSYIHKAANAKLKSRIEEEIKKLVTNADEVEGDEIDKEAERLLSKKQPTETRAQRLERQANEAKAEKANAEMERDAALRRLVIVEEQLLSLEVERKALQDSVEKNTNISLIDKWR